MAWTEGRRLGSVTVGGKSFTYTYDRNGIRSGKTSSDGSSRKYYLVDGKAVGETVYKANGGFAYNLRYTFDENGSVCGISYWGPGATAWTKYYFTKNLQGDVTAVYRVEAANNQIAGFTKVAAYTYDAWGNVLSQSGDFASINPFRYRSYYYDTETGFYYVSSRYYDPEIGRFINADSQLNAKDGMLGYNLFAYCNNNPIMYSDPSGHSIILACIIVGAVIGGLAGGHIAAKVSKAQTGKVNGLAVAGGIVGGGVLGGLAGWGIGAAITAIGAAATGAASTAAAPIVEQAAEKASTALQTYYPPNNGFSGAIEKISLDVGTIIQRTGDLAGRFTAPAGTPSQMLSLPYDKIGQAITYLQTTQPIQALSGTVAPWFGQIGGGTQYLLLDGRVDQLIAEGILKILGE